MEENIKLPRLKVIKHDSKINLEINPGMIEKLQEAVKYFLESINEDQLKKYKEEIAFYKEVAKKEKEFSEPWMYPLTTITFLINDIQIAADEQGCTYEMEFEEYVKSKIGDITEEDN